MIRRRRQRQIDSEWPPAEYALPDLDTLERLSQPGGELRQRELFGRDDSREARLQRILGTVPQVTTANTLTGNGGGRKSDYPV